MVVKRAKSDPNCYWKGYKIEIYPTNDQKIYIDQCINLSRKVYNWALDQQEDFYKKSKISGSKKKMYLFGELTKKCSNFRNKNKWLKELPFGTCKMEISYLLDAYKNFFNNKKFNKPKHKRKKDSHTYSCYPTRYDRLYFRGDLLHIEGLAKNEYIKMSKNLGIYGYYHNSKLYNMPNITNTSIKKDFLGRYFVMFSIQLPKRIYSIEFFDKDHVIGIDLNVKDRFVCSNGYRSGSPDLKRLNRNISKKRNKYKNDLERKKRWEIANPDDTYVESNRAKRRHTLYLKSSQKLVNVVENFIQTETRKIINWIPRVVCMENLQVTDIYNKKGDYFKRYMHSNFFRCKEVMKRKCEKHGITFIEAKKDFASSQICSRCGSKHKIPYNKDNRLYICPDCGLEIDRDDNASINLQHYALDYLNNN